MRHESMLESEKRRSGNKNNTGNRTGLTVVHPWKKVLTKKETHQAIQ